MGAQSVLSSQWGQHSRPFWAFALMLAVLVFLAHVLSPTKNTLPELSLDKPFDTGEGAVDRTPSSAVSSEGFSLTGPSPLKSQDLPAPSNSSSSSGTVHATDSEVFPDAWNRIGPDNETAVSSTKKSKQGGQDLRNDMALQNVTSADLGVGLPKSPAETFPEGRAEGVDKISRTESGTEPENGSGNESNLVSKESAPGRANQLLVKENDAKVETGTESKLEYGKETNMEMEDTKGKQERKSYDGGGKYQKDNASTLEGKLATGNGFDSATQNRNHQLDSESSADAQIVKSETGAGNRPPVQNASTATAINATEFEFDTGSMAESNKRTTKRTDEEPGTATEKDTELGKDQTTPRMGDGVNFQHNETHETGSQLDEEDERMGTKTEVVDETGNGTVNAAAATNWTKIEAESGPGPDVGEPEMKTGKELSVGNVAGIEAVSQTEAHPVTQADSQADQDETENEVEEETTSDTGNELEKGTATKQNQGENITTIKVESPTHDANTRENNAGPLETEVPKDSDANPENLKSEASENRNLGLESRLHSDKNKPGKEGNQTSAPDTQSVSKAQTDLKPPPQPQAKDGVAEGLVSGLVPGAKIPEAGPAPGREGEKAPNAKAAAGGNSKSEEKADDGQAKDTENVEGSDAGTAKWKEGKQSGSPGLQPVTASDSTSVADLMGVPDWAIEHYLDDPKAAAERPRLNPKCNLYKGRWVYDKTYPIWTDYKHPSIKGQPENCQARGRNDTDYMKLRWQPDGCNLPRFDAADVRKRLWGQRLVYVGDSLGRNMFASMVGMLLHGADLSRIKEGLRETNQSKAERWKPTTALFFTEHNFTVEYYRTPVLVELKRAPKEYGQNVTTLVLPNLPSLSWALPASSADIVVFNTGHWFNHWHLSARGTFPEVHGALQLNPDWNAIFKQSLRTWARWARQRRNAGRQIFFRGVSPSHLSRRVARTCPAESPTWDPSPHPTEPIETLVKQVWHELGQPAEYLDITALSALRNDAHVGKFDKTQDCSHWCFPGVPDTWNELLVATMLLRGKPPFDSIYAANLDNSSGEQTSSKHK